jgi:hypothetical protein
MIGVGTEQGLKKSTRDWDADTKSKQSQNKVQDLSLVSRSDDNEKQRCEKERESQ